MSVLHVLTLKRQCGKCQMFLCTCSGAPQERDPKIRRFGTLMWLLAHLPVFPFGEKDYLGMSANLSREGRRASILDEDGERKEKGEQII